MKTIDLIKPDIYDAFQCKGSSCRRTCCAGWRITVNKSEYQDLKEKLNHSGEKILRRLPEKDRSVRMYGEFILEKGRGCSLQSDDGLCKLQLSLGAEALPDVCAFFPRKSLRCEDEMQLSLTPACERVLELLLEKDGSLEFIRQKGPLPPMDMGKVIGSNAKTIWNRYIKLQEFCILLLQARDVSLDMRMALLSAGLYQINTYHKEREFHKVSGYIDRYLSMISQAENADELLPAQNINPTLLLGTFLSSTSFSIGYSAIIDKVQKELQVDSYIDMDTGELRFSYAPKEYERRKAAFLEFTARRPFFLENLMVMLFVMKRWGSSPYAEHSIWEQYMYACWVYSNLKLALTACMETISSDEELLDICVVLLRSWIHNDRPMKAAIEHFHDTGCDTPAHMAMLVQAG